MTLSLESGIIALIVGIVLVIISRTITIEQIINKILYIVGIVLVIIATIAFILFGIGIAI